LKENILTIIKALEKSGYSAVSLSEIKYHYRKQYQVNVEVQQLAKALQIAGYKINTDGTITIGTQPAVSHFHALPQTKVTGVFKN